MSDAVASVNSTKICTIGTRTSASRNVMLMGGTTTPNSGFQGAYICLSPCGATGETQQMARNISAVRGVLTKESETAILASFNGHGQDIIDALRPIIRRGLPHATSNGPAAK